MDFRLWSKRVSEVSKHIIRTQCKKAKVNSSPLVGGGRGMRVVHEGESIEAAITAARSEAATAFSNDMVFLERFLDRPKHIEVQVLSDRHGNHIHLFERDCSVQRKHQKVVEFAPAANLAPSVRQGMLDAACTLAKALNYGQLTTCSCYFRCIWLTFSFCRECWHRRILGRGRPLLLH